TGKTYAQALAAYQAEPKVKILWETGNVDGSPAGTLLPRAQTQYSAWPIPGVVPTTWYLRGGHALRAQAPGGAWASDSYRPDPTARPRTDNPSNNIWGATPNYNWQPVADGSALFYETLPLPRTVPMAGARDRRLRISAD